MLFEPPAREPGDIFCPRCGARNKASYRFCTNCAADLAAITGLPAGAVPGSYPVRFDVAYPEKLSRISTFFRLFLAIPQLLIIYALIGLRWAWVDAARGCLRLPDSKTGE